MERTFSPMIRQFSAIDGLQKAYTLVYSMDTGNENGCCLTLCRTGSSQRMDSKYMAVPGTGSTCKAATLQLHQSSATGSCAICVRMASSRRSGRMW